MKIYFNLLLSRNANNARGKCLYHYRRQCIAVVVFSRKDCSFLNSIPRQDGSVRALHVYSTRKLCMSGLTRVVSLRGEPHNALGWKSDNGTWHEPAALEFDFSTTRWYIVKSYLQSTQRQIPDQVLKNPSTDLTDEQSLYQLLTPALEIISSKYAAVGILEEMTTSMRLFNSALGMNNFNWTVALQRAGHSNSDKRLKDEEHAAVREALTDPAIIKFVSLDIILYEHAVNVYKRQLREYGLDQI